MPCEAIRISAIFPYGRLPYQGAECPLWLKGTEVPTALSTEVT